MKLNKNKRFVIAEIGHNHQGSIQHAKKLIKQAKLCGADAVKLQKRDNKNLYTNEFYNSVYDNPNSFARTYGAHREKLEFNFKQYKELQKYSKKIGIYFFATPFDFNSVKFLKKLGIKAMKIASADIRNTPLQTEIAKSCKTVFLSTGGSSIKDVERAKKNICKHNKNLIILHCTSSYPCRIEDMNLNIILKYKKLFKNHIIGLSDHENGIDAAAPAYMLGARVFEKHFTLNRANKGTDNAFSLEPSGLSKFIRTLDRLPVILGNSEKKVLLSEKKPIFKMAKSIVASRFLKKGSILKRSDINFKSPGGGVDPYFISKFLGKKLTKNLKEDDKILFNFIK
jgi:sialic acid synthase